MTGWLLGVLAVAAVTAGVLLVSGCSPLVTLNDLLVPTSGYQRSEGIAYGPEPRQRLDVYAPTVEGDPRPVVVFFYGGSWRSGRRELYPFVGEALTAKGLVAVVPDYRLYPDVRYPAFVADGAQAVAWVREHIADYGGDPDRIVLAGHSAGAHIAAMLAIDDRYLAAAGVPAASIRGMVGLAGPYAFDPFQYRATRPVFEGIASPAEIQPGTYADGDEPPMLLLHGTDDRTVYPVNSQALADRIQATGGTARMAEIDGAGHIGLLLALARPFRSEGGVADRVATFAWQAAGPTDARSPTPAGASDVLADADQDGLRPMQEPANGL